MRRAALGCLNLAVVQTREERAPSAAVASASPRVGRTRRRVVAVAAVVVVVLAAVLLLRLGAQERGGPAHTQFVSLPNGAPATLYLPYGKADNGFLPVQPAADRRPPVAVVAHGYAADQNIMSSIARS